MEWLILPAFLLGWATCWIQESQYLNQVQESMLEKESALQSQLDYHSETVVVQEMEILKLRDSVLAKERELELLRYRT